MAAGIVDIEEFVKSRLPPLFINHVKTVVKQAEWLCQFYPEADREIVTVSAWLHDIGQTLSAIEQYRLTGGRSATSAEEEEPHHIRGLGIAQEYLTAVKFRARRSDRFFTASNPTEPASRVLPQP